MPRPTWVFSIDLSGFTDITEYVQEIEWQLGFPEPYEVIARIATLDMTLNNGDKRFSPENAGGPYFGDLTRGALVRVQSIYTSTITHFVGRIRNIVPEGNIVGQRSVKISCTGLLEDAQDAEIFIGVQESVTADEVISTILLSTGTSFAVSGRWKLGTVGSGELGQNTYLASITDILSSETGISIFTVIGDAWSAGTSIYSALRDTAGREYGRLFIDRAGQMVFWNRHHFILDTTSDVTITEDQINEMEYSYGDNIRNKIIVRANPRLIGSTNEQLGRLDKSTKIGGASSKTINFRYLDQSSGANIAGKNAVAPAQTTDFTANSEEDGSGTDLTSFITSAITEESSTRSRVQFTNSNSSDAWIQSGAQIRGIKITDFGMFDMERSDTTFIHEQRYTYPYIMDDIDVADSMAQYLLDLWKVAQGTIRSITIPAYKNVATLTQALTRTIGGRITFSETQTQTSDDYFIIGERWHLTPDNGVVTWFLEKADAQQYWVLNTVGFGELGQKTVVGPF